MTESKLRIGPWVVNSSETQYENPWINVVQHDVTHPDGSNGIYGVVRFNNLAIGVLPIDENSRVPLVGQHRFPQDHYSWELPEGGGPLDVPPLVSAKRELVEETGLSADSWIELCQFDISNSVTDEKAVCFLAAGLTEGIATPEPSEELALQWVPFEDLYNRVLSGDISDSLTIVMTLSARAKALRGDFPASICQLILADSGGK